MTDMMAFSWAYRQPGQLRRSAPALKTFCGYRELSTARQAVQHRIATLSQPLHGRHYTDITAYIRGDQVRQRLRAYGFQGKALPKNFLFDNYKEARRRAEAAAANLAPGQRGPNPSSSVGALAVSVVSEGGKLGARN
jgi:hypothetical protein